MTAPLVVLRTGLARISQARTRRDDRTLARCLTSFFLAPTHPARDSLPRLGFKILDPTRLVRHPERFEDRLRVVALATLSV